MPSTVTSRFAGPSDTLTIAAGVITPTRSKVKVDTEAAAASDDLDTISNAAGIFQDGDMLLIQSVHSDRHTVVKNGTGNIHIPADFTLTHVRDTIIVEWDSTENAWLGVSSSNNGA